LSTNVIDSFTWKSSGRTVHSIYSNFFVEPDGSTVEREFQAEKHRGHPWRQKIILAASNPARAKKLGRKWRLTKEEKRAWDRRKLEVMKCFVRQKFLDHPDLASELLDTGDVKLVEENWWHDNFWGNCKCMQCFRIGDNHLGRILMEVRDELRLRLLQVGDA
jgi:ribA/ribD-fused uncharacterized protein